MSVTSSTCNRRRSTLEIIKVITPRAMVVDRRSSQRMSSLSTSVTSSVASESGYSTLQTSSNCSSLINSQTTDIATTDYEDESHQLDITVPTSDSCDVKNLLENIAQLNSSTSGKLNSNLGPPSAVRFLVHHPPNTAAKHFQSANSVADLEMVIAQPPPQFADIKTNQRSKLPSRTPPEGKATPEKVIKDRPPLPKRGNPSSSQQTRISRRPKRPVKKQDVATSTEYAVSRSTPCNPPPHDRNALQKMRSTSAEVCVHSGNAEKPPDTSPVLKRLFSVTLTMGLQIYTDWANHYLEKVHCPKRVQDLQKDLSDGVLLSHIIQSVTGHTLQGINYNPRSASHMVGNLVTCLDLLRAIGVNVEDLTAKELHEGNLKCVLGLFFNLSRFKQQMKANRENGDNMSSARITATGLKVPSSAPTQRKLAGPSGSAKSNVIISANKRSQLQAPSSNGQRLSTGSAGTSVSSRSTSPVNTGSGIPPPGSKGIPPPSSSKLTTPGIGRLARKDNSIPPPSALSPKPSSQSIKSSPATPQPQSSGGMLDKLFKSKKTSSSSTSTPKISKSDDKTSSKTSSLKKEKTTSTKKSTSKDDSKSAKPPLSSIPRGGPGGLSSRSRTPSRESLYKCRIQPPPVNVATKTTSNRLSSDSGIHSPAELKPSEKEPSGLKRNNSLPSSKVHSTKDGSLGKPLAKLSSFSPHSSKRSIAMPRPSSTSSATSQSTGLPSSHTQQSSTTNQAESSRARSESGSTSRESRQLQIPPPISTTKPTLQLYNQMPGINHYMKPASSESPPATSTPVSRSRLSHVNKDNINEAKKQQLSRGGPKVDGDTQTDTSALQNQHPKDKEESKPALVHATPGLKSSQSKIKLLSGRQQTLGAEASPAITGKDTSLRSPISLTKDKNRKPVPSFGLKRLSSNSKSDDTDTTQNIVDSVEKDDTGSDFQVEPMQPLDKLASYEFLQRLGLSQTPNNIQQTYKSPLTRFGNMNRSFNTKKERPARNVHEDYASDAECYANGYISDTGYKSSPRTSDYTDMSGYMSEGGASNYARQLQQRFQEGMQLVREALNSPKTSRAGYLDADDDSFDEDEASSISSGDLSDTLDLAEEGDVPPTTSRLHGASNPTYVYPPTVINMRSDGKTGSRPPLSLARSSISSNGYMSDSSCAGYSIAEQAMQEQQRAKGLISSKTQQTLVNRTPDDLYKYYTLGRSNRGGSIPPQSYSLLNGPPGPQPGAPYIKHNPYMVESPAQRRSYGSESDSQRPTPNSSSASRSTDMNSFHARTLSLTGGRLAQHRSSGNPYFNQSGQPTAPHLLSHIHQGGYESDSGVVERKLCQNCCQPLEKDSKNSELRGSALSLTSTTSSVYSTMDDQRRASEVQKLRKELDMAKQQVFTLTSQLTTNAQVVQAFEQSLGNMTFRLQHLQSKSDQKDSELGDMKSTIDNLRRMTGLAHTEILQSANQQTAPRNAHNGLERQMSADSINSMNSMSSACSQASSGADGKKGKVKKSWIRNSFSKAFGGKKKVGGGSLSDAEDSSSQYEGVVGPTSAPGTPTHGPRNPGYGIASYLYAEQEDMTPEAIAEMKKMLREKEMKLTDIRLDALTSAHQLEQLRDAMSKMKHEMSYLKADNDRLHRMVGDKPAPLGSAPSSTISAGYISPSASLSGGGSSSLLSTSFSQPGPSSPLSSPMHRAFSNDKPLDFLCQTGNSETDNGKRVTVSVVADNNQQAVGCFIGSVSVTGKTKWDVLDSLIKRVFKQYLSRIDQSTNLGLNSESIHTVIIGEIHRTKTSDPPELLPYGYLVGETTNIKIILKGAEHSCVDSLAFETGIPKAIIQRYASLLAEHRRIILSGPTGTGKSHLAKRLSSYLMAKASRDESDGGVTVFDCEVEGTERLKAYLTSIQLACETSSSTVPHVIILDNLHHVSSLSEAFSGFLSPKSPRCPFMIGTMSQTSSATTNLQLQHNFRWILCANHMEPVKGFLARFLRRKLVESEVKDNALNNDLCKIIDWIPKVWQHFNKFIETHHSTDATIGPRQFLDCPMDVQLSQKWFSDLWNFSLMPYLKEAIKEGIQKFGQKSSWEEPTDWLIQTYPWQLDTSDLLHLRAEDVGYDKQIPLNKQNSGKDIGKDSGGRDVDPVDPLYNMILRLREASYSSAPDNESLDSHTSALLES